MSAFELSDKTEKYSNDEWNRLSEKTEAIFAAFAALMRGGDDYDSPQSQRLVQLLQEHISQYYYICTNDLLAGLGQMYRYDERYRQRVAKYGEGFADFLSDAIEEFTDGFV